MHRCARSQTAQALSWARSYRHFPQRSDLIVAVFQTNVDACADSAPALAIGYPPMTAVSLWMERYVDFIGTKQGLCKALSSGNATFESLPEHFNQRLRPALRALLDAAIEAKEVRPGSDPRRSADWRRESLQCRYGRDSQHARRMAQCWWRGSVPSVGVTPRKGLRHFSSAAIS